MHQRAGSLTAAAASIFLKAFLDSFTFQKQPLDIHIRHWRRRCGVWTQLSCSLKQSSESRTENQIKMDPQNKPAAFQAVAEKEVAQRPLQ
jgi:hypothetical protein